MRHWSFTGSFKQMWVLFISTINVHVLSSPMGYLVCNELQSAEYNNIQPTRLYTGNHKTQSKSTRTVGRVLIVVAHRCRVNRSAAACKENKKTLRRQFYSKEPMKRRPSSLFRVVFQLQSELLLHLWTLAIEATQIWVCRVEFGLFFRLWKTYSCILCLLAELSLWWC